MTHDEFTRREEEARDIIDALGRLSRDRQASADFPARIMARAEQLPSPRRGFFAWLTGEFLWPTTVGARVAVAAVCLLVVIGAASQYMTWIKAYLMGVPSSTMYQARLQERLWEKNFACATQLDQNSNNYAVITGEHVVVVAWACPSGDVLVTVESPTEELSQRSVWVAFDTPLQTTSLLQGLVQETFAATLQLHAQRRSDPVIAVLCQKWLPNRLVKRRIRRADGKCSDVILNPRNGRVISHRKAPCNRAC